MNPKNLWMHSRLKSVVMLSSLSGVAILISGTLSAMVFYNHCNPSNYSLANHFVSELGWLKTCKAAWIFNWSLAIGGLLILPMMIVLGQHIQTNLGIIATVFGLCASVSGAFVGVFPMDHLAAHLSVTTLYWLTNTLMVFLFTLALVRSRAPLSRLMVVSGLACSFLCTLFMVFPKSSMIAAIRAGAFKHPESFHRPGIWWAAVVEWMAYISSLFWLCTAVIFLWRVKFKYVEVRPKVETSPSMQPQPPTIN